MQLQQIPFYYPINTSGLIQAAAAHCVGQPQNIMIPSASSSGGQLHRSTFNILSRVYPGKLNTIKYFSFNNLFIINFKDPRMYGIYPSAASVNPGGVNPNWQLARSPPHQQQQQQQPQINNGLIVVDKMLHLKNLHQQVHQIRMVVAVDQHQHQVHQVKLVLVGGGPPMTPQYTLNGGVPAAYAYAPPTGWIPAPPQVSSPQTNIPPQVNVHIM